MEEPLLESRQSRDVSSRNTSTIRSFALLGRASAIASGDKYERAAALVDLAEDGEGIPRSVLEQENSETAVKLYFMYTRLNILWSINLAALLLLSFFEVPLWCKGDFPEPCGPKDIYFLGDLPYLTRGESLVFEIVILVLLYGYTLFPILFMGGKIFRSNQLNIFKVILILLLTADTIANTIYISPSGAISTLPFRLAPYIRVCVVAVNLSTVRASIKTIIGIIPDFVDVAALLALFVFFSSWLAYVLFEDTVQGREVFTSFPKTLYSMTILFTTSNNPDVWLPAYKQSRFASLFFVVYILIGVYFITNLVLAVVYDSFKRQLAEDILEAEAVRKGVLDFTFDILDDERKGYLDLHQCVELFQELNNYRTLPKIASDDMEAIFYALDDSGDFKINKPEFTDLCQAISLKFDKTEQPQCLDRFPAFYNSPAFASIRKFVRSTLFEYIVVGMLTLNLITVLIETTLDLEDDKSQHFWQKVELSFGWIYLLELGLKVLVYGFRNYWQSGQNKFDFIITWFIVIGETLEFALPDGLPYLKGSEWIRYLLIARLLRLVRVLMVVERYRVKVVTFLKLIPNLLPYLGIIFLMMCIYCTIGIQVFGGLVYAGNPTLPETTFADNDYFEYNFNDFPSGMVTLFNILVMGNWQVWMEVLVFSWNYRPIWTSRIKWWPVLYFMSFYAFTILFLLNLVVAFVLEAFFAEIDIYEETKEAEATEASTTAGQGSSTMVPKSEAARLRARRGKDNRVQTL